VAIEKAPEQLGGRKRAHLQRAEVEPAPRLLGGARWKHAYLARAVEAETALKLCEAIVRLAKTRAIVLESELKYLERAFAIALEHGLTVYDALYVAQAEKLGELLTSDREQGRVAEKLGVAVHLV